MRASLSAIAISRRGKTIENGFSRRSTTLDSRLGNRFRDKEHFLGSDLMARRPIFVPNVNESHYVTAVPVEFKWYPGFTNTQTQKSIASLHEAAEKQGISPVLEVSRKSMSPLGASLSAFDLMLKAPDGQEMSVECAYQGSKVFEKGGPYHDLYSVSSRTAKTDERLRNSGEVIAFSFYGEDFPIEPQTAFYDWLYMTALCQKQSNLANELKPYQGFSDIFFNPKLSINCQARALAVFVAWNRIAPIDEQMFRNRGYYMDIVSGRKRPTPKDRPPENTDCLVDS